MKVMKKMHFLICSLLLVFTGIFFVACGGNDYSKVSLTSDVSNIVMELGEEKTITFTIQNYFNGMSGELNLSTINSTNCIEYEASQPVNGVTNVTIKALNGGSTSLRAVTIDGLKECIVSITVKQYSNTLENTSEKLYVSNSTTLAPSASNFVFEDDANERGLNYFLYGTTSLDDRPLTLDDVKDENQFINEFVSISLVEQDSQNYLIFKDKENNLFTLSDEISDLFRNVFYRLIPIVLDDGQYIFSNSVHSVSLGERFTFIAKYSSSDDIFVQRDFYVLTDITKQDIPYSYSYLKINNTTTAPISGKDIVLVPEKEDPDMGVNMVDYKTVRLEVRIPTNSNLVKVDQFFDNQDIATIILLSEKRENEETILTYQISSKSTTKRSTNLNINFYYEGWKDVIDSSVNYVQSIPVKVEFEPNAISVNGERGTQSSKVYTFYNNYASTNFGWQEFNVMISRNDSSYENLLIEFDANEVMLRYNGTTYSNGSLQITDLSQPIYFKGVNNTNNVVADGKIKLTLNYIVLEPATLTYDIRYNIIAGAKTINYSDEAYSSEGIYIAYNPKAVITFKGLYADASFNSVNFEFKSGQDVVGLDDKVSLEQIGNRFFLVFNMLPKAVGSGVYTVTLDNGTAIDIIIRCIETLDNLSVEFDNADGYITGTESDESSTTVSIINDAEFNRNVQLKIIANGNELSSAIRSGTASVMGSGFTYTYNITSAVMVSVTTSSNGNGSIIFTINGYTAENFKRTQTEKRYTINVISYSLIERINVDKLKDGKDNYKDGVSASYTYVYIGAENENAQTAMFNVRTRNNGYRFFNPNNGGFTNESFDKKFIYWTVSGSTILKSGRQESSMYYNPNITDNVYTIDGCGTFNTETMTFTSFASAANNYQISLIANIRQPDRIYSYTISISALTYSMVNNISLQEEVKELYFSSNINDINQEIIIHSEPITATNSSLSAIFIPNNIIKQEESDNGEIVEIKIPVNIFGEYVNGQYEGIQLIEQNAGTYLLKLNCEKFVGSELAGSEESLEGTLIIAASDWLDGGGSVKPTYQTRVLRIVVKYENGTKNNPFHLETSEDVLAISNGLNAYYEIATAIDMNGKNDRFPLGNFSGSIIGTNDYAKIYGIKITNNSCDEEGNYGLFSNVSGVIKNVQFEGNINITDAKINANIGLVTAVNNGSLINLGVVADANSNVTLQGNANIGFVAGLNNGNVLQDFLTYSEEKINVKDNNGNDIVDQFGDPVLEDNPLYGLSSHILVYMAEYYLNITNLTNIQTVKVGGVIGDNNGSLQKIDNQELRLFGYSGYLAYSNINVEMAGGNLNAFGDSDEGVNYVGAAVGYSGNSSEVVGQGYGDTYEKGEGIVVGGFVNGPQYVGGVVGCYKGNENSFAGITARTFVRGYTSHIGIITGLVRHGSVATDGSPFVVQAVDDRRLGEEASMLIRYLVTQEAEKVENLNVVGFGAFESNGYDILNENNVFTYLKRDKIEKSDTEDGILINSNRAEEYYGDYIEVSISQDSSHVLRHQTFFKFDKNEWSVSLRDGFKPFVGQGGDNVFYANYFEAANVIGGNSNVDLSKAQNALDREFNTVNVESDLYPFEASNGLIFNSVNSDIVSFNQSGIMSLNSTGLAKILVSSILNTNDSLSLYIKVVNYFNSDEKVSIVYPDTAEDSVAVDETQIKLKGNNSVTLYVKPDYSYHEIVTKNGIADMSNMRVTLSPNTEIVPIAQITSYNGSVSNLPQDENSINIAVNGQTITFSKNIQSFDGMYGLEIQTMLKANIPTDFGSNEYYCYVNKDLLNTQLVYTKGAESISMIKYDSLVITSSKEGEDTVIVDSLSEESDPLYILYNSNGDAVQGSADWIKSYLYDESGKENWLFNVVFNKKGTNVGLQEFAFSIAVNKNSSIFTNRYEDNIYGNYTLEIYADSNHDKMVSIPIYFENMNVYSISIDNYDNISYVETSSDFSTSSKKAFPGNTGLLILNISPEDADYDYIEIVNTAISNQAGNGKATFNLVAKYASRADGKIFDENVISGSTIANGIRLNLKDIISIYDSKDVNENYIYEKYRGIIYISYLIGTNGVVDGGLAQFQATAYKGDYVSTPSPITLTLNLNYFAEVTVDGKEELKENEQGILHSYQVARGLRYKLNLDYYGFAFDNIKLTSSSPEVGEVVYENGSYYFNVTSKDIDFSNYEHGYPVSLFVNAYQKEGELERSYSSITRLNILEYVVNYIYTEGDDLRDLVVGMDDGVINVQIGNIKPLQLDLSSIIEYDRTIPSVVSKVNAFTYSMAQDSSWTVYTNLNDSGISTGQPVYISTFDEKLHTKYDIKPNQDFDILYFRARGLNITPLATHNDANNFYVFSYNGRYKLDSFTGGFVSVSKEDTTAASTLYTEFKFNVYQSSSSENPVPIDNYDDFIEMQDNVHYILTSDIVLDNTFAPLEAKVASLDGNGYTIYFNGLYNFEGNSLGIFSAVDSGSVIKNLTVALSGNTTFRTASTDFYAGLITGENSGNITNCYVYSGKDSATNQEYFLTVECGSFDSASYVAGIAGQNSGNITNSRSSINISSSYNIAGLVGINNGNIASSYFKNGKLICTTQYTHNVAGLVVSNESSGKIITSYVSGETDRELLYSTDTKHYITSTSPEAGFAYSNLGEISDCYTNINLLGSSTMAGFVHDNGGKIRNCFSTSVLIDKVTSSAGFSMAGSYNEEIGTFENCYYFYNDTLDFNDNNKNNDRIINSSLANVSFDGVSRLNYLGFSDNRINNTTETYLSSNFTEYAYSASTTTGAVWFYSSGNQNDNFNNVQFNSNRLELVAPNVISYSKRELTGSIEDEYTGQITYVYVYAEDSSPLGSLKNPYLVNDAETLERNMLEPSTSSGYNDKHYRLISDIDYSEYGELSKLYNIIYYGGFEGNGMTISQIDLVSTAKLVNAGMFAQIGRDANSVGTVMNLNLDPMEVSFVNANCVGGLAGTLSYGNIYNVQVTSKNKLAVLGNNFVGGVVGRTINSFTIKNVTSNVSSVAYYKPAAAFAGNSYSQSKTDLEVYSYAGGIVGFAAGSGVIHKVYADSINDVMGSRVGVALGGFDKNVTVEYLYVNIISGLAVKAYDFGYAGLAVGEVKGKLVYVQVDGSGSAESPFKVMPGLPKAVGGVAGMLSGGTISYAYMNQGFRVGELNTGGTTISNVESVGGIVGLVDGNDAVINNSVVNQDIQAVTNNLGGIIGFAGSGIRLNQIAVKSSELYISGRLANTNLGGFVGRIESGSTIIEDCYTDANLKIETFVYTQDIVTNVGSFVGQGTPNTMRYCYSTGNIDVQIEDKRSVNVVSQVLQDANITPDKDIRYNRTGINFEDVYYYGYNNNGVINNDLPILTELISDMIIYKCKIDKATATFNEKAFGSASFDKLNSLIVNSLEGEEEYIKNEQERLLKLIASKDSIYEIIRFKANGDENNSNKPKITPWFEAKESVWKLDKGSLITYLAVEDSFTWIK